MQSFPEKKQVGILGGRNAVPVVAAALVDQTSKQEQTTTLDNETYSIHSGLTFPKKAYESDAIILAYNFDNPLSSIEKDIEYWLEKINPNKKKPIMIVALNGTADKIANLAKYNLPIIEYPGKGHEEALKQQINSELLKIHHDEIHSLKDIGDHFFAQANTSKEEESFQQNLKKAVACYIRAYELNPNSDTTQLEISLGLLSDRNNVIVFRDLDKASLKSNIEKFKKENAKVDLKSIKQEYQEILAADKKNQEFLAQQNAKIDLAINALKKYSTLSRFSIFKFTRKNLPAVNAIIKKYNNHQINTFEDLKKEVENIKPSNSKGKFAKLQQEIVTESLVEKNEPKEKKGLKNIFNFRR